LANRLYPFSFHGCRIIIHFVYLKPLARPAGITWLPRSLARNAVAVVHNPGEGLIAACAAVPACWSGLGGLTVSVEERVIEIVCENLGVNKEQVTRSTKFIEDIGADSLDIVELVMELEEEFEITIPDDQAEKIKTVGEAIEYIERELGKK
jgi:acyl carrier protein